MKAKQLAEEVYEKLVSLDYARKANDFTESGDTYFDNLFQEVQDAIRSFPISYVDHREDLMDILIMVYFSVGTINKGTI